MCLQHSLGEGVTDARCQLPTAFPGQGPSLGRKCERPHAQPQRSLKGWTGTVALLAITAAAAGSPLKRATSQLRQGIHACHKEEPCDCLRSHTILLDHANNLRISSMSQLAAESFNVYTDSLWLVVHESNSRLTPTL